jgi:hypothetical protein
LISLPSSQLVGRVGAKKKREKNKATNTAAVLFFFFFVFYCLHTVWKMIVLMIHPQVHLRIGCSHKVSQGARLYLKQTHNMSSALHDT